MRGVHAKTAARFKGEPICRRGTYAELAMAQFASLRSFCELERWNAELVPPTTYHLRKYLSGIQNPGGIERGLHALHERDLVRRKLDRQIRRLGEADAVLAAD